MSCSDPVAILLFKSIYSYTYYIEDMSAKCDAYSDENNADKQHISAFS